MNSLSGLIAVKTYIMRSKVYQLIESATLHSFHQGANVHCRTSETTQKLNLDKRLPPKMTPRQKAHLLFDEASD